MLSRMGYRALGHYTMDYFAKTKYKERIRITKKDREYIRKLLAPKQSMANKLEEIIKYFKDYGNK